MGYIAKRVHELYYIPDDISEQLFSKPDDLVQRQKLVGSLMSSSIKFHV
jgi:hypothetical protein